MKSKKLKSKLKLGKERISNLNKIKGGKAWTFGCYISKKIDCISQGMICD